MLKKSNKSPTTLYPNVMGDYCDELSPYDMYLKHDIRQYKREHPCSQSFHLCGFIHDDLPYEPLEYWEEPQLALD